MFITWRTFTATVGLSTQLEYVCMHCGARAVAAVETKGAGSSTALYGAGGDTERARAAAATAAQVNARIALQQVACPNCFRHPPNVTNAFSSYTDTLARNDKRAWKLAALVGLVALAVGVGPGVYDLRHSISLLVGVLAVAATLSAFVFSVISTPPPRPFIPTARIHFWWGRPDGVADWLPPPPVQLPPVPAPSKKHTIGLVCGAAAGIIALVAFVNWWGTFTPVYVVAPGSASILVDSKDVTKDASTRGFEDLPVAKLSVRSDNDHRLTVGDRSFTLARGAKGWVVAPESEEKNLCFASVETVYGSRDGKPGFEKIDGRDGLFVLSRAYDEVFEDPPKTMSVQSGQSGSRWGLRAVWCHKPDDAPSP